MSAVSMDALNIKPFTLVFRKFITNHTLMNPTYGVDNHGSIAWEAVRSFEGLNRYITLALTIQSAVLSYPYGGVWNSTHHAYPGIDEMPLPRLAYPCIAEIRVVADDGLRFVTKLVDTWQYTSDADFTDDFGNTLMARLERAWDQVVQFHETDLTESYLVPRDPPGMRADAGSPVERH